MSFFDWITANGTQVVSVLILAAGLAAAIAKFTPTPKDDAVIAKILGFLNLLPHSAKATLLEKEAAEAKKKATDEARK